VDWNPNVAGVQRHPGLSENIRIYNPSSNDVTIEITFNFDLQPGTETFRRTIGGRRVAEFNIDEFITGNRRQQNQSYGIFVKAATPISRCASADAPRRCAQTFSLVELSSTDTEKVATPASRAPASRPSYRLVSLDTPGPTTGATTARTSLSHTPTGRLKNRQAIRSPCKCVLEVRLGNGRQVACHKLEVFSGVPPVRVGGGGKKEVG
jgi:hypothetical protein